MNAWHMNHIIKKANMIRSLECQKWGDNVKVSVKHISYKLLDICIFLDIPLKRPLP